MTRGGREDKLGLGDVDGFGDEEDEEDEGDKTAVILTVLDTLPLATRPRTELQAPALGRECRLWQMSRRVENGQP